MLKEHLGSADDEDFNHPSAIITIPNVNVPIPPHKTSKLKAMVPTRNKRRPPAVDANPLLSDSDQSQSDEENPPNRSNNDASMARIHNFVLMTYSSKTRDEPPSKCFNVRNAFCCSNIPLLFLAFVFLGSDFAYGVAVVSAVVVILLNVTTLWKFCGDRLLPSCFKHDTELVFDDDEKRIYIHWDGLMKQSTIKYDDFVKVYSETALDEEHATVYFSTKTNKYRLTKYLADIDRANLFVNEVNHWWSVDRMERREKMLQHRMRMFRKYSNQYSPKSEENEEEEKEEVEEEKTEEDIYWENCEELEKLIKKLKYKSFAEQDIETGSKLKQYFDSKYRVKMVEEYQNLKAEVELNRNKVEPGNEEMEMMLNHPERYITSALLLKVDTVDRLIQHRKSSSSILELEQTVSEEIKSREEEVSDEQIVAEEV